MGVKCFAKSSFASMINEKLSASDIQWEKIIAGYEKCDSVDSRYTIAIKYLKCYCIHSYQVKRIL